MGSTHSSTDTCERLMLMRSTQSLEVAGVVLRPAATGVQARACASILSRALLPPEIVVAVATAGETGATGAAGAPAVAAASGVGVETAVTAGGVAAAMADGTEASVRAASRGAYSRDRRNLTPSRAISNRSTSRAKALGLF